MGLTALLLAACPGSDEGGRDAGLDIAFPDGLDTAETSESYSFVELCDGYADACCKLERCIFPDTLVSDEACKKEARAVCEAAVTTPLGTHIDPGTVRFSPEKAGACYAPYLAATCDALSDVTGSPPIACVTAFDGTLAQGASCAFDALCQPALFCKPAADGTCPGTCQPRAALGAPCTTTDALCERELVCSATRDGQTGVCMSRTVAAGAACAYQEQCPDGTFCHRTDKVCAARGASGAACDLFGCGPGLYCAGDDTCRPTPVLGEACEFSCAGGAVCIDGTCVTQPVAGDSCDNEFSSCGSFLATLQCEPTTKKCVPFLEIGADCGGPNGLTRCAGGYCDGDFTTAGKCRAPKGFGEACSDPVECGRLGCIEGGTCGVVQSPCRGPSAINTW